VANFPAFAAADQVRSEGGGAPRLKSGGATSKTMRVEFNLAEVNEAVAAVVPDRDAIVWRDVRRDVWRGTWGPT